MQIASSLTADTIPL